VRPRWHPITLPAHAAHGCCLWCREMWASICTLARGPFMRTRACKTPRRVYPHLTLTQLLHLTPTQLLHLTLTQLLHLTRTQLLLCDAWGPRRQPGGRCGSSGGPHQGCHRLTRGPGHPAVPEGGGDAVQGGGGDRCTFKHMLCVALCRAPFTHSTSYIAWRRGCNSLHPVLVHTPCSIGMSHMAEYTCCSSVAFERPNEHTFTFTFSRSPVRIRFLPWLRLPRPHCSRLCVVVLIPASVSFLHRHGARAPYPLCPVSPAAPGRPGKHHPLRL
jgi:hypothetical protein